MITKRILFGQPATHACDGICTKAWGINGRPSIPSRAERDASDNPDYAFLADDELGEAPVDPGTYEGGHAKPIMATGPEHINKWCIRECERSWMSPRGQPDAAPTLPNFSTRLYNIAPNKREPAGG
jgi:hypothetical protein